MTKCNIYCVSDKLLQIESYSQENVTRHRNSVSPTEMYLTPKCSAAIIGTFSTQNPYLHLILCLINIEFCLLKDASTKVKVINRLYPHKVQLIPLFHHTTKAPE